MEQERLLLAEFRGLLMSPHRATKHAGGAPSLAVECVRSRLLFGLSQLRLVLVDEREILF